MACGAYPMGAGGQGQVGKLNGPSAPHPLKRYHRARADPQRSPMSMRPITAADVMNPRVLAAAADWTLPELADFLVEHEISGAPVVDAAGRLLGVVSVTDIAA